LFAGWSIFESRVCSQHFKYNKVSHAYLLLPLTYPYLPTIECTRTLVCFHFSCHVPYTIWYYAVQYTYLHNKLWYIPRTNLLCARSTTLNIIWMTWRIINIIITTVGGLVFRNFIRLHLRELTRNYYYYYFRP